MEELLIVLFFNQIRDSLDLYYQIMAVMLRTVSSLGRLACSTGAACRVWCGIESTSQFSKRKHSLFKDQEPSFSKSKNAAGFLQSVDLPALCQAAVAIRPLPTRQSVEILERRIEVEKSPVIEMCPATIDQHAEPCPRSFLAESVDGNLVECSSRGSRPLYTNVLSEFQLRYTGSCPMEISAHADNTAAKMAFEAALENDPSNARIVSELAMFTWKALGEVDAAEELFNKALELAPHDADIQASHALFLWQCDE